MNQELRSSFILILKNIMGKKPFDDAGKEDIEEVGFAMMDLKKIAVNYCGAEKHEFLSLVINASKDTEEGKVDVDEHIQYCKLLDIWKESGLDFSLINKNKKEVNQ